MDNAGEDFKISPRLQNCGSYAFMSDAYQADAEGVCIMFMDTDREKEIGLGADYPYEPLGPGECVLPEIAESTYNFNVGDELKLSIYMGNQMRTMASVYNYQRSRG